MADEIPATQPPPPSGAAPPDNSSGLSPNVAAGLACVFPIVGGVVFLILEKKNGFVRFYAMQSIFLGGVIIVLKIALKTLHLVFGSVPFVGLPLAIILFFISMAIGLAWLVVYIIQIVKAFSGVEWEIPYLGAMARKQLGSIPAPSETI